MPGRQVITLYTYLPLDLSLNPFFVVATLPFSEIQHFKIGINHESINLYFVTEDKYLHVDFFYCRLKYLGLYRQYINH